MTAVQTHEAPHRPVSEVPAVHAAHEAPAAPSMTHEEWAALHSEDASACRIIISIMAGIFITGLVIYLVICLSALGN